MLRVTIELVPWGDLDRSKTLAEIDIVNEGSSGVADRGHYYSFIHRPKSSQHVLLPDFPRQSYDSVELLRRILNKAHDERS